MSFIVGFAIGVAIGGGLVVVFSKNNKNTIADSRAEILAAAAKGRAELEATLTKIQG